jgi:hypothetical protein
VSPIDIARECGDVTTDARGRISIEFDDIGLTAFAAHIRSDAMEEAAKVCDDLEEKFNAKYHGKWPELRPDCIEAAQTCAYEIRAAAIRTQSGDKTP